jgi:hypothetical protein
VIVEPSLPADVSRVAQAMRQRDRDEFMALSHFERHDELVKSLVKRFGGHPDVFTVFDDPGPVAVGGMLLHRPNVATLLFFATDDFKDKVAADFTRFVKQRLFAEYRKRGVHRIECAALAEYDEMHRWLKVLGLVREAVMLGFGRAGETYLQFSWVKS